MDLTPKHLRQRLDLIAVEGWESVAGRSLLEEVRTAVVGPVVRRSGLRGLAASQAEATGWAAAWDALRRPSARTAENPGGMVWIAVRRAVRDEPGTRRLESVSLELCLDSGWHPAGPEGAPDTGELGPMLRRIVEALTDAGWSGSLARDAVVLLAESAAGVPGGTGVARWRWVAMRLGIAEWQVRRLAALLLGGPGAPGVPALMVEHGPDVLDDEGVLAAVRSTACRWAAGPTAHLADWAPTDSDGPSLSNAGRVTGANAGIGRSA